MAFCLHSHLFLRLFAAAVALNADASQGLYRVNQTRKAAQPFLQRSPKVRVERPLPNMFTLFKGEFWVALHRDFCEYIHESPDNVARSLQVGRRTCNWGINIYVPGSLRQEGMYTLDEEGGVRHLRNDVCVFKTTSFEAMNRGL